MSNEDIIRAWKDEDYCNSLSQEKRSQLPDNPAGAIELSQEEMEIIQGGANLSGCNTFCWLQSIDNRPECTHTFVC